MARAKRILITLDVEEFCDALSLTVSDAERSDFVLGFQAGIRGTQGREDAEEHFMSAYTIGIEARIKKNQMSNKCSIAGKKGYFAILERMGLSPNPSPLGSPYASPMGSPDPSPMGEDTFSPDPSPIGSPYASPDLSPMGDTPPFFKGNVTSKQDAIQGKPSTESQDVPPLVTLPCLDGKVYQVTQATLDRWKDAYTGIDPLAEAKKMRLWLEDNPARQKTHKGMGKFISNWLGNAQKEMKSQGQGNQTIHLVSARNQLTTEYLAANQDFFGGNDDVPSE